MNELIKVHALNRDWMIKSEWIIPEEWLNCPLVIKERREMLKCIGFPYRWTVFEEYLLHHQKKYSITRYSYQGHKVRIINLRHAAKC